MAEQSDTVPNITRTTICSWYSSEHRYFSVNIISEIILSQRLFYLRDYSISEIVLFRHCWYQGSCFIDDSIWFNLIWFDTGPRPPHSNKRHFAHTFFLYFTDNILQKMNCVCWGFMFYAVWLCGFSIKWISSKTQPLIFPRIFFLYYSFSDIILFLHLWHIKSNMSISRNILIDYFRILFPILSLLSLLLLC